MKPRLPSLNAMRSFEAAARHQSFTLAAAELSVSPAAIGYQVKRLEEDFGKPLFTRAHRAIKLTPDGAALMRKLSKGFEDINAAWTDTKTPTPQKEFKVTAPIAVVQKWLLHEPALQAGPDDDVRIVWDVVQAIRDLKGSSIDAAIRYTATPDPSLFSEPLLRQCYTPIMRPDVARKIKSPKDVVKHGLINLSFDLAAERNLLVWKPWFEAQGLPAPDRYEMSCGYTMSAVEMVTETGYIAMGGFFVVADDIAAGRIVAPFDVGIVPKSQLWFQCEKGRENEPEMIWFRDVIQSCAGTLKKTAAHLNLFDLFGQPIQP